MSNPNDRLWTVGSFPLIIVEEETDKIIGSAHVTGFEPSQEDVREVHGNALLMASAKDMKRALESTLMFLTNVNTITPAELAERVIAALVKAGMDQETADGARAAMVDGACSLQNMPMVCSHCDGDGAIETAYGTFEDCPHCAGTGFCQED